MVVAAVIDARPRPRNSDDVLGLIEATWKRLYKGRPESRPLACMMIVALRPLAPASAGAANIVVIAIISAAPVIEKFEKGSHPEDHHGRSFRELIERCRGSLACLLISGTVDKRHGRRYRGARRCEPLRP